MNGNLIDVVIAAMLAGSGVYGIISSLRLKKVGKLFPNKMLYPGRCEPADCVDVEGFIEYIVPKMIIFGILCIILAAGTVVVAFAEVSFSILIFEMAVVVAVFAYIGVVQNKASKLFW